MNPELISIKIGNILVSSGFKFMIQDSKTGPKRNICDGYHKNQIRRNNSGGNYLHSALKTFALQHSGFLKKLHNRQLRIRKIISMEPKECDHGENKGLP